MGHSCAPAPVGAAIGRYGPPAPSSSGRRAVLRDAGGRTVPDVCLAALGTDGEIADVAWTDEHGAISPRLPPGRHRPREEDAERVLTACVLAEGQVVDLVVTR